MKEINKKIKTSARNRDKEVKKIKSEISILGKQKERKKERNIKTNIYVTRKEINLQRESALY